MYVKFLYDVLCQKLSKLANAARSYLKNKGGTFLFRHGVFTISTSLFEAYKNIAVSSLHVDLQSNGSVFTFFQSPLCNNSEQSYAQYNSVYFRAVKLTH